MFSAGCHSGYNIVDADGVPGLTLGLDWAQEMAQQKAILIAGTGYQYADTNFLAYSAKLYTMLADELRAGAPGTSVAIGQALVKAKQDYLESLTSVGGIDQKAIIESTMYGLPMTGMNMAGARTGRTGRRPAGHHREPSPPAPRGPRWACAARDVTVATPTTPQHQSGARPERHTDRRVATRGSRARTARSPSPRCPPCPSRSCPRPRTGNQSLRGVGFRSGTYTDTSGVTPLTGCADHRAERPAHDVQLARRSSRRTCSASTTSMHSVRLAPPGRRR